LKKNEDLDSCPTGFAASADRCNEQIETTGHGYESDCRLLLVLTERVDLGVVEEGGPWPVHRIDDLGVSACDIELDPFHSPNYSELFDSTLDLLASRATEAATAITGERESVSERKLLVAIRVLALHRMGQLTETLERQSNFVDSFLYERYAIEGDREH